MTQREGDITLLNLNDPPSFRDELRQSSSIPLASSYHPSYHTQPWQQRSRALSAQVILKEPNFCPLPRRQPSTPPKSHGGPHHRAGQLSLILREH